MEASILCGGEGTRLRPLTYSVPKPLLPLGAKPILEVLIGRMKDQGFDTFYLMVNYKAEMIRSYFGSGSALGVRIEYFEEHEKRGTAGPLCELKNRMKNSFVVLNADLLTSIRFNDLLAFHTEHGADMTVALKRFKKRIAYGVAETSETHALLRIDEKPSMTFLINSGIYAITPKVLKLIPAKGLFQMTDLINKAIKEGMNVIGFEFEEPWRDIGRLDDYMKAVGEIENGLEGDTDGLFL